LRLFTFFKTYYPRELKKSQRFRKKCPTFLGKSLMIFGKSPTFFGEHRGGRGE